MKLKRVIRLDSTRLNRAFFTDEGYLVDTPIVTSTGIFEYTNPDGSTRRELRLPDEVFDPLSLASYEAKPVIITHDAGLVTKDNVAENEIGTILTKGFRDGENVRAKIVIHDTDEMKQSGLKELSLGYNLDLDETPGEWNGQPYDAIQRNIRINHLALVREARAGEQARLNIDGRGAEMKGVKAMSIRTKTRRSDGILSPDELKEAIKEYRARHPEAGQTGNQDDDKAIPTEPMPEIPVVEKDAEEEKEQVAPVAAPAPAPAPAPEEQAMAIKEKQEAKKDAEEDDLATAKDTIAHQDEDIQTLLDIIDTLLAERDFKDTKTDAEETATAVEPEEEEMEQVDGVDDDIPATNEAEVESVECAEKTDSEDDPIPSTDKTEVMNADSIDAIVRTRVKLGIVAEKLNLDGLEELPLNAAKKAVINAVRPSINLDGKGATYINAMFDMACEDVKASARKNTKYQKKQMFNGDSKKASLSTRGSAEDARQRMIERRMKKNKEVN